jgi:hypothetical protein
VLSVFAMMRGARVALAVIAILSIAYVLITPDPTDDVEGVLRPNYSAQRIVSLPLPRSPVLVIVPFLSSIPPSAIQRLTTSELLDLVCVCRCKALPRGRVFSCCVRSTMTNAMMSMTRVIEASGFPQAAYRRLTFDPAHPALKSSNRR